jgi:hypothetical protein
MAAFWVIATCSLVEADRRFRDAYYPYHLEAARTSQSSVSFNKARRCNVTEGCHQQHICSNVDYMTLILSFECTIAGKKIGRLVYSNSPPGGTVVIRILRFFVALYLLFLPSHRYRTK